MRELTKEEVLSARKTVEAVLARNGIEKWEKYVLNPFLFEIALPASVGKVKAVRVFNSMFHALGILPKDVRMHLGDRRRYCAICTDEDNELLCAEFNHPVALGFDEHDEEYQYVIEAIFAKHESEVNAE